MTSFSPEVVEPNVHVAPRGAIPELPRILSALLAYCQSHDWAGFDPYDALNSRWLQVMPWLDSKWIRLTLIQALKRCPVNLRPILAVPPTRNPKALGLFLSAIVRLSRHRLADESRLVPELLAKLAELRSPGVSFWCWGYCFPWQTRTVLVPRGYPNLVCTVFAAEALLDVFENRSDLQCLDMASSAADYITRELFWRDGSVCGFAYPLPNVHVPVHNANFLAAAFLCRVGRLSGRPVLLETALRVARYSAQRQSPDGAWDYGEAATQRWRDNFHTGYNLCALQSIARYAETAEFDLHLRRGYSYYRNHFFTPEGAARYYNHRTFPVDAHSVAQSIITLLAFRHLDPAAPDQAVQVWRWAIEHLWDPRGCFHYQKRRFFTVRIPYMRWVQAWMLLASAHLLDLDGRTVRTTDS